MPRFSLSALILVGLSLAAQTAAQDLQHGTYSVRSFKSPTLDRSVDYGVYVPKTEGEARDLPLIVWLHGMREDHRRFNVRGGAAVLDRLIGEKVLPPCILVSPNGTRYGFWIDGKDSGPFEKLVTKDLLTHVGKTYPVSSDRTKRAIAGVSMGGLGALKIAMRKPDLFGVVSAHSAALFPPDADNLSPRFKRAYEGWGRRIGLDAIFGDPIDAALWKANNPLALAGSQSKDALGRLAIRFDAGTDDRYGFHEPGQMLHRLMTRRGIRHEWKSLPGVGHSWGSGSMPERLEAGLGFIARAWKQSKTPKKAQDG